MKSDLTGFIADYDQIPLVIGELGINHQGSTDIALDLIRGAAEAGVHAIKFQYRNLKLSYNQESREIGDEILKAEIEKNYLSPEMILSLVKAAKECGLWVGISFFIIDDCSDFGNTLSEFDFFKIPSVELMNHDLIDFLINTKKPVLISTGAHWEEEIDSALSAISGDNWFPLHCVSNYPVAAHNSNLSYISHLNEKWKRPVGFSSHESDWEFVLIALQHKPRIIERHLTIDKNLPGLDQTTSSNLAEFTKMIRILKESMLDKSNPKLNRCPNQGELLNRQNLGRSFYFSQNQSAGQILNENHLVYRSPQVGINKPQLKGLSKLFLVEDGVQHSPLLMSHFEGRSILQESEIEFAKIHHLALPVRLHDYKQVQNEIPIDALELHLSYSEIDRLSDHNQEFNNQNLSLHLPDYINPLQLIDPISSDLDIRLRSLDLIKKAVDFVSRVQEQNGYQVLLVGSFPIRNNISLENYYEQYADIQTNLSQINVTLTMQWLPPFAWYFGGSELIRVFNSEKDVDLIKQFEIDVCMDISHLILGSNYFKFDPFEILTNLDDRISFFHLSDAEGFDGEGTHFDLEDHSKLEIFRTVLNSDRRKTLEVWQGHFDHCSGFKRAIRDLHKIHDGENNGF